MEQAGIDVEVLAARIAERLAQMGLSERKASLMATGQPDAIRYIRTRRAIPSLPRLLRIAQVLKANPSYLMGTADENDWEEAEQALEVATRMSERALLNIPEQGEGVPVFELTAAVIENFQRPDGDWHPIELGVSDPYIDDVIMPIPSLKGRNVHVFHPFNQKLSPAFDLDDPVVVDFDQAPGRREFALVRLSNSSDPNGDPFYTYGRVVSVAKSWLTLEQFNPPVTFRIPLDRVKGFLKILTYKDLLR